MERDVARRKALLNNQILPVQSNHTFRMAPYHCRCHNKKAKQFRGSLLKRQAEVGQENVLQMNPPESLLHSI